MIRKDSGTNGPESSASIRAPTADEKPVSIDPATKEERLREASIITRNYLYGSVASGLVPIPVVNLLAISAIQLKMLHSLSCLYGVEFNRELGKALIGALAGGILSTSVGSGLATFSRNTRFIGTIVGFAGVSITAGATTYALARIFIRHFESGGTFLTINLSIIGDYFRGEFMNGKKVAVEAYKAQAA